MRFFSKITFILNLCFLVAVVFWYLEMHQQQPGNSGRVIRLPAVENSFVILGYGAIIVNLFFLLVCFIYAAFKINSKVPRWIIIFNLVLFCCQVFFHFIYK